MTPYPEYPLPGFNAEILVERLKIVVANLAIIMCQAVDPSKHEHNKYILSELIKDMDSIVLLYDRMIENEHYSITHFEYNRHACRVMPFFWGVCNSLLPEECQQKLSHRLCKKCAFKNY